jgi:hypothetical protein
MLARLGILRACALAALGRDMLDAVMAKGLVGVNVGIATGEACRVDPLGGVGLWGRHVLITFVFAVHCGFEILEQHEHKGGYKAIHDADISFKR